MESSVVLVGLPAPETFHVVLELGLHDPTDGHYVTRDASIDQVILDLAINSLWQFSCVDISHVILDLLNADSLVEGGLGCVLLWVEDARSAVGINALVR